MIVKTTTPNTLSVLRIKQGNKRMTPQQLIVVTKTTKNKR